jgi:tryptophan-rich sensory protein
MNKLQNTVVVTCLAIGYLSGTVSQKILTVSYLLNQVLILLIGFCTRLEYVVCDDGCCCRISVGSNRFWKEVVRKALVFFAIQLALNALWSYLFFGLHNPMLAGIEIIILWLMILKPILSLLKSIK